MASTTKRVSPRQRAAVALRVAALNWARAVNDESDSPNDRAFAKIDRALTRAALNYARVVQPK